MDAIQIFNDEIQSLLDTKPPVSKAKMGLITRAAMKGIKFYKHIVLIVEKFIAKCRPEYKVPGLYVIDSIVRQSRHQFGSERDVYALRFSRNFHTTFENLFSSCLAEDKPKILRVLDLWSKNGLFSPQVLHPLMSLSNLKPGSILSRSTTSPPLESTSKLGQSTSYHNSSSSGRNQKTSETSLKFTKNMLDFDYGEEDDDGDETPTEAEPPLSSTLNKIEMEQRGQHRNNSGDAAYKSSQFPHHTQYHQPDPVLERWNRIIRGENADNVTERRSRSRSPSRPSIISPRLNLLHSSSNSKEFVYKPPVTQASTESSPPIVIKSNSAKEAERALEREKRCLPEIRDMHLTVCSSTLWLGHVPKTISEADLSNAFGEYGTITSIDLIPPRGCAYVCMDRRQDAKRALNESKDLKLNGSNIKMAWAPGKGFKEYKKFKDFWEVETGSSYIPYSKIDDSIDFDVLEEGGLIDEDSMSMEMRERREKKHKEKRDHSSSKDSQEAQQQQPNPAPVMSLLPPPPTSLAAFNIPPPSALSQGMIHYPPPTVPIVASTAGGSLGIQSQGEDTNESNKGGGTPSSIDQQLNITERQISMVEQQLNMIKQAQSMANPMPTVQQAPIFTIQNQPNPMIFEMPLQTALLPGLDPNIFVNPAQLLCQPPTMLPQMSQAGMIDPSTLHNNMMPHQRY